MNKLIFSNFYLNKKEKMSKNYLEEVFGMQRGIPLNYVKREEVDDLFAESLKRKHHIVVYGSSKQGKTCLRKKCLPENDYILVQCSNKIGIGQLNELILKQAGFQLVVTEKKTTSGNLKVKAVAGFKLFAKAEGGIESEIELGKEIEKKQLELDLEDVNDIIEALQSINFQKFIVLEDFHYLKKETQVDFAVALKAYYDNSKFIFIIVGVWLEENRLIALNGDLFGRIISINADSWGVGSLTNVVLKGCYLLNIKFADELIEQIIMESFDNVCFVQEICYRICRRFNIAKTVDSEPILKRIFRPTFDENGDAIDSGQEFDNRFYIKENCDVNGIVRKIVDEHSGRYNSFITQFADGFHDTDLEMYKWLLYPLLVVTSAELEMGLGYRKIKEIIISKHPKGKELNIGNLTQALKSINSLQLKKDIRPNIIDYDETTSRLNIVDKGFIIWIEHQNKNELLNLIGLPTD
jgi:hypothetical protein